MHFGQSKRIEDFEGAALPHLGDIHRTAVRVVRDRVEADDIVQEVYFQAWKSFDRFTLGTNCRAWLYKILFHVVQHHRRKWYRFKWNSEPDDALENSLVSPEPIPEKLRDEDILAALDRLPIAYREVVLLADVEEFSYREIAEGILGVPMGTVMSRLSRGRAHLRNELAGVAKEYGIKGKGETA